MLIGELATRTGTSPRALRHYERLGLLPSARRANRYRDLPEEAVDRRAPDPPAAGRRVRPGGRPAPAAVRSAGTRTSSPAPPARSLVRGRLLVLERSLQDLGRIRDLLRGMLDAWDGGR